MSRQKQPVPYSHKRPEESLNTGHAGSTLWTMIHYPELKTTEVLKHEQMSRGISSVDRLLAGGLDVGVTHHFLAI